MWETPLMSASFRDEDGHIGQCERCEAMTLDEVCGVLRDFGEAEARDIVAAFARVVAGTYGFCVDCHREIDPARLSAARFTERCTPCEQARERQRARGAT
jgi:hypothetical protein